MLEKTITTDTILGLQKASVKLTLPVIEITSYRSNNDFLNISIKQDLLHVITEIIEKQLE